MTRTTDPPPEPFKSLGSPVPKATPEPPKSQSPARGEYGVMQGPDGRFRTTKNPYWP